MNRENIDRIFERMWKHPKCFEGIKCKTCLPLDYIEEIINEEFALSKDEVKKDE